MIEILIYFYIVITEIVQTNLYFRFAAIEMEEPQRKKLRTETEEPTWVKSRQESADPSRAKLRNEKLEARCTESMTERAMTDPTFCRPITVIPEPSRTKLRTDILEPVNFKNILQAHHSHPRAQPHEIAHGHTTRTC